MSDRREKIKQIKSLAPVVKDSAIRDLLQNCIEAIEHLVTEIEVLEITLSQCQAERDEARKEVQLWKRLYSKDAEQPTTKEPDHEFEDEDDFCYGRDPDSESI